MAFLKNKIILLFCLFLHLEKAHFQFNGEDGQDDFPQRYARESSLRKKYETSWRSEDDQDQEQLQAQDPEQDPDEQLWPRDNRECPTSICSAENANALRFEKPWPKKLASANRGNKEKHDKNVHNMALKCDEDDVDDGVDEDDDDEDDDDDDENDDYEYLSDGEQEAFLARMSCLMRSLDKHTRAIHRNLKTLQSRLNKAHERSSQGSTCRKPELNTHPKDKWFENPQQEAKENDPEQCARGPQSPQSLPSNSDNRLKVSPLLKLLNNPAALQSKPESPGYWMSTRPKVTSGNDISVHFNKRSNPRYEEYEARLRRLMANRDAIERNVMKVMGPSRKMPRK
ncbi:hypothetical protein KR074_004198 [Drosophila pseudoananassae]|nr:hypothetical protein KR074_004198 [Drosophila pseudoananassae]